MTSPFRAGGVPPVKAAPPGSREWLRRCARAVRLWLVRPAARDRHARGAERRRCLEGSTVSTRDLRRGRSGLPRRA